VTKPNATHGKRSFPLDAVPLDTEEARAFLQHRLSKFGKWVFLIGGLGFLMEIGVIGEIQEITRPYGLTNLALLAGLGAVWILCRMQLRIPTLWLRVIDTADVIGLSIAGVVMTAVAAPDTEMPSPWPVPALVLNITLYFRAAFIPSTPRRTAVLGTIGAAITVMGSYLYLVYGLGLAEPSLIRIMVGSVAIWCTVAVAGSTLASHIIFGLRKRAREAAQLGQYTLVEKIGEGGMGAVYRARHALLRRPTAIKLLLPERTNERDLVRFEREVQLTSQLTHPNTIAIYDFGRTPDNVFYYAMEFIDGISLERLVDDEGPQPPGRVIHMLVQACGALAEAHGVGLIHRDIKPANLLLCARGGAHDVIKVVDFGLIKDIRPESGPAVTTADTIAGTPHYLSPESINDPEHLDARADIYALGAVGYWLLTGKVVFEGRTVWEVCSQHLLTPPSPPSARLGRPLPEDLEKVILHALEKEVGSRFDSAEELRVALLTCRDAGCWSQSHAEAWWAGYRERSSQAKGRVLSHAIAGGSAPLSQLSVDIRARQADRSGVVPRKPVDAS
jgi:eukaryotic-like serine/threonine-protein kinase